MTAGQGDVGGMFLAAFAVVVITVLLLGFGIWFGMVAIAPRIIRRQDRAEEGRDEPGDRHD